MKKVFVSEDRFQVQQVKELLAEKKIPCFVKNEFASGAIGELSPIDAAPEVWVFDDEWQAKALEYIALVTAVLPDAQSWVCNKCGEHNEASFEICWNCALESPS